MFYFLFMILMFYIFGKLFFFGLKAAWGLSKFVLTIILLPITLMVMVSCGLLYFAFVLLIVVGIISFLKQISKCQLIVDKTKSRVGSTFWIIVLR